LKNIIVSGQALFLKDHAGQNGAGEGSRTPDLLITNQLL
jgi:hypothetical protein